MRTRMPGILACLRAMAALAPAALATAALATAALATAALATAALAETAAYDLHIRGLKVGEVDLQSRLNGNAYELRGDIRSTGLAAMIRRFSYRGTAAGRIEDGRFVPTRYEEAADTGNRSSEALMEYTGGVPRLLRYLSPREAGPDSPDPVTQGDTVDPLTAIYLLLRDVPRNQACKLDIRIFDGKRRSRITLAPGPDKDGLPGCTGVYERLQGFTRKETARHVRFPMTVEYAAQGDMLRVERVAFKSLYGVASIDRR